MKKSLLFALILGGVLAFTSCASDEECVCSNATYTQSDADDAGTTLNELCSVAKIGDSSCSMK
ncbi:MAG: hypothetical protein A3K10_11075 [Bacteroidetes bacterium RIFCSPLOWO2_12_FULL_31_6]|nr:MAG: hypothetical protein A3K10_11075 [Bacteroidetes bacterium RIFCSPLOWO2_12_FULL_31_6]